MVSKAKIQANARYNQRNYETVQCRSLKSDRINDLIDKAIDGKETSKAAYILGAIRARLNADGVTLESIASPADDPPTKSGGEP